MTKLYCAPARASIKVLCQFTTPYCTREGEWIWKILPGQDYLKAVFDSVLTIPHKRKDIAQFKTNLTQPYISISFFERSKLYTVRLNTL
jgi:hypothetical protein